MDCCCRSLVVAAEVAGAVEEIVEEKEEVIAEVPDVKVVPTATAAVVARLVIVIFNSRCNCRHSSY